jgi:hypothetical protein
MVRKHLLLVVEQEAYPPNLRVEQPEGEGTPEETQGLEWVVATPARAPG